MKDLLNPLIKDTCNNVIKIGITPSWRDAVIPLIPKEGKDKTECGSYQPVSVLNQDYKIYTRILAKILPHIISLYPAKADTRSHLPNVTYI